MIVFSNQYNRPCVVYQGETADELIEKCACAEALFYEEGPSGDPSYVVQFRDAIGPEIWTESAIRRTCKRAELPPETEQKS